MNENIFSIRLKTLRSKNNLTQLQLGELVSLSKQAINDLEHGRRNTTSDKLILLADSFNVSVDYLLGRTEERNQSIQIEPHHLVREQSELLNLYDQLSYRNQIALIERAKILIERQEEESLHQVEKNNA